MVDIAQIVRVNDIAMNDDIRTQIRESRADVARLQDYADAFDRLLKELEGQDKLGNFEIQDLISRFNEAESLASSLAKKRDCLADSIIHKV